MRPYRKGITLIDSIWLVSLLLNLEQYCQNSHFIQSLVELIITFEKDCSGNIAKQHCNVCKVIIF